MGSGISLVLPTYDRAEALRTTLPHLLGLNAVDELIVVDDGSSDGTAELLAGLRDPRVKVVRLPVNRGVPTARNAGAARASGDWVLFVEDDCRFPPDYAAVLREEAEARDADVVSAPMLHVSGEEDLPRALDRARAEPRVPGLDGVAGFPAGPLRTALLQAPALVRSRVLEHVRFDAGFRGNAYREESDFFLRAAQAGYRCLLTPRTYFWEERRYGGGAVLPLPARAWWTARNNWRFLRRHARWLQEHGLISHPWRAQLRFVARRAARLVAFSLGLLRTRRPPPG